MLACQSDSKQHWVVGALFDSRGLWSLRSRLLLGVFVDPGWMVVEGLL